MRPTVGGAATAVTRAAGLAALLLLEPATARAHEPPRRDEVATSPQPAPDLFDASWPLALSRGDLDALQAPDEPAKKDEERWSSFLPLMKEEALSRGYELPLPFGAGLTCTILSGRDIEVTDLRIAIDGGAERSVAKFADLGSSSDVFNANLKLDAWILPFLNVYALLGYVYNESETDVHITVPIPGPPPGNFDFDMTVDTNLDGFVGGGGILLAGGYRDFFMVVDSNYSQTDIGFDDNFRAITASIRAGYQGRIGELPLQIWTGVAWWDTANTAKGHADVPGVGRVDFEADQGPEFPWLMDFGGNCRFSRGFELAVDLAFDFHGGVIATIAPIFRF